LPKLAETAGRDIAQSVALMVATIVFVPLVMPLIVPGLQANALGIAGPLVVLMLVPLGIGFAIAQLGEERIARFLTLIRKVSNLFFVVFLLSLTVVQFKAMLQILGSFAIGTYLIFGCCQTNSNQSQPGQWCCPLVT
jgi:BASS family bile acid:Na+ symporter